MAFTLPIARGALLANNPFFESLSKAVTDSPSGDEVVYFWSGVGIFVLVVVLIARSVYRRETPAPKPKVDYLTVASDLLGLSEAERRELQKIAKRAKLDEPASMLLSPQNLARAAGGALTGSAAIEARARVEGLAQRLFSEALPEAAQVTHDGNPVEPAPAQVASAPAAGRSGKTGR